MEGDGKGWVGFVGNGVERVKRERVCGRGEEKESELPELNQRPLDLQSNALPTELSSVCLYLKPRLLQSQYGEERRQQTTSSNRPCATKTPLYINGIHYFIFDN